MFIIQLFNSLGCSLKLQRKLYAGSFGGDKPGDSCANCSANGARNPAHLQEAALTLGAIQFCAEINELSTSAA